MRLNYSVLARRDLSAIWAYIAAEDPRAADQMLTRLDDACHDLLGLPERGRVGKASGTRELVVVKPYIIVYVVARDGVEIIRIFHAAQDR